MIELWLIISTVCFWSQSCTDSVAFVYEADRPRNVIVAEAPYCIQQVHISTFYPKLKDGERVYNATIDGHVAIPRKVWDKVYRSSYWNTPINSYDEFDKLLDEAEWLIKVSADPKTTDITREAANKVLNKIRTKIQENAPDKKVNEPYYPHIHKWTGPYAETLQWEKCYCGKQRRKEESWKWIEK